jgi:site-specific recombinase
MLNSFRRLKAALTKELSPSDLTTIIQGMNLDNLIDERMTALEHLMHWIRLPIKQTENTVDHSHIHAKNVRFKFLLQFIERNPVEAKYFIETLRDLLGRGVAVRLYYLTGVSENTGFFSEFSDRLILRLLPHVVGERDLAEIFRLVFTEIEDAEWFEASYKIILPPIIDLIKKYEISTEGIINDQDEALIILGSQIASLGVSKGIRTRLGDEKLTDSSFIRLNKVINNPQSPDNNILQEVSLCQINLQKVKKSLEATGVSVDLIYNIERIKSLLQRVEMLVYLKQTNDPETKNIIISRFIGRLIRDEIQRLSLKEFLSEHLKMLTKKLSSVLEKKAIIILPPLQWRRSIFFMPLVGPAFLLPSLPFLRFLLEPLRCLCSLKGFFIL